MNPKEAPYKNFALAKEMFETAEVVKHFDPACVKPMVEGIRSMKALLLTGEGSSRIFPAKRAITRLRRHGVHFPVYTEGATQAMEYLLGDTAVLGASNSGKTKEVVRLFKRLKAAGHKGVFGVASAGGTPVVDLASKAHVLSCGKEAAVAATKSVVEQALFIDALCFRVCGLSPVSGGSEPVEAVLSMKPPAEVVAPLVKASKIYFAGRADGVAEELTLKTNEITRKKSAYLEGTYAAHGIEEVMDDSEVVVVIDPFPDEEAKFEEVLVKGVGIPVVAIATRPTRFPTFIIPEGGAMKEVVELCAGWNLLLETGLALGIDLDKPVRARKVGNEYLGG